MVTNLKPRKKVSKMFIKEIKVKKEDIHKGLLYDVPQQIWDSIFFTPSLPFLPLSQGDCRNERGSLYVSFRLSKKKKKRTFKTRTFIGVRTVFDHFLLWTVLPTFVEQVSGISVPQFSITRFSLFVLQFSCPLFYVLQSPTETTDPSSYSWTR